MTKIIINDKEFFISLDGIFFDEIQKCFNHNFLKLRDIIEQRASFENIEILNTFVSSILQELMKNSDKKIEIANCLCGNKPIIVDKSIHCETCGIKFNKKNLIPEWNKFISKNSQKITVVTKSNKGFECNTL